MSFFVRVIFSCLSQLPFLSVLCHSSFQINSKNNQELILHIAHSIRATFIVLGRILIAPWSKTSWTLNDCIQERRRNGNAKWQWQQQQQQWSCPEPSVASTSDHTRSYFRRRGWDDWIAHFESTVDVNGWDKAAKLLWLRVRLTGWIQTAFKQLSKTTCKEYDECIKERLEPVCKQELYLAEFQARRKRKEKYWASYAEDLRVLADKAFLDLQTEAKELLTLNHFLGQTDNPQIAIGLRRPKKKNGNCSHCYPWDGDLSTTPQKRDEFWS